MNANDADELARSTGEKAERDLLVRPFGYVEDRAVVRRIGGRDLYLGNRLAADPAEHDYAFEYVLTLSSDEQPLTTHHYSLVDGSGNDWTAFETAVDTARRLYRHDGPLLIHCTAGISRSAIVVATMLAAEEGLRLSEAFATVLDARPHAISHPALYELAVVYLAAQPSR